MKKFVALLFVLLAKTNLYAIEIIDNGIHFYISSEYSNECWVVKDTDNSGVVTSSNYSGMIALPSKVSYEGKEYSVTKIDDYAFYDSEISFISIPNSIKEIGINAFHGSLNLEKVILPSNLEIIPKYCFGGCSNLKSITIPENVIKIDEGAFQYSGLESLALPPNVQYIGDFAFANSKNLKEINIPDALLSFGIAVFRDCPKLQIITIPEQHSLMASFNQMLVFR